jgi:DNA-directed RNA polymerase subunit RPC12/RpoP
MDIGLNRPLRKPTISAIPLCTEAAMPHEYFCHSCKKTFSKTPTPSEHEEGEIACPNCGSDDVEQCVPASYPISPKKTD